MELQSLLILLLALIISIVSAWSLSTFMRLHKAVTYFKSDRELSENCNITNQYVNTGTRVAIALIIISVLVLIASSFWFIKSLSS